MALPKKVKHLNIFVDGINWIGEAEDFTFAKLTRKLESYRGGGMPGSASIDLGFDDGALDTEFTMGGYSAEIVGKMGCSKIDGVMLRFAGSIQRDDTAEVQPVEVVTRGRMKEIDWGTAKMGDNTQSKVSMVNTYYKLTINGQVIHEIDLVNMIEIGPDGVDRMAEHRTAIGL
ncbi:phage major tail tube protein [Plesiomonas shigelloides]|uniref:phage major tail tube protein n=1 Tax=Plesiomonas shigelloides TaxID=703 RepID=UPI00126295EF|nr:phage major tail tube protein [Plesiomonas shigelloides]KAB7701062.1 phage major tail tube protein [Plesiomonas shigelloides]